MEEPNETEDSSPAIEQPPTIKMKSITSFFKPKNPVPKPRKSNDLTAYFKSDKPRENNNELSSNGPDAMDESRRDTECPAKDEIPSKKRRKRSLNKSEESKRSNDNGAKSTSHSFDEPEDIKNVIVNGHCSEQDEANDVELQQKGNANACNVEDKGDTNTEKESVSEMSYEDFLQSQLLGTSNGTEEAMDTESNEQSNKIDENDFQANVKADENEVMTLERIVEIDTSEKPSIHEENEKDEVLPLEKPKGVASITSFFTKVKGRPPVPVPSKKDEPKIMTVQADVHHEPSKSKQEKTFDIFSKEKRRSGLEEKSKDMDCIETSPSSEVVKKSNVVAEEIDLTIELLESKEIEPPFVREKRIREPSPVAKEPEVKEEPEVKKENQPDAKSEDDCVFVGESKQDEGSKSEAENVRKQVVSAQMAALDSIKSDYKKKTAQATLCFGTKGVGVGKVVKSEEKDKESNQKNDKKKFKSPEGEVNDIKGKRGRKKKILQDGKMNVEDGPNTEVGKKDVEISPNDKASMKGRRASRGSGKSQSDEDFENKDVAASASKKRRGSCQKCENCMKTDDCKECVYCKDMKKYGGPGKLKQKCKTRHCLVLTKKNRAKQLVAKARSVSSCNKKEAAIIARGRRPRSSPNCTLPQAKRPRRGRASTGGSSGSEKQGEDDDSPVVRRRSGRIKATIAEQTNEDDKKDQEEPKPSKKKSSKIGPKETNETACGTPKKGKTPKIKAPTDGKTPSKAGKKVKLAPIFGGKKSGAITISDEEEEVKELTPEELARQAQKRSFLLSGVPEAMRKQQQVEKSIVVSEYAPWPTVSHVQQISFVNSSEKIQDPPKTENSDKIDHGGSGDSQTKPVQEVELMEVTEDGDKAKCNGVEDVSQSSKDSDSQDGCKKIRPVNACNRSTKLDLNLELSLFDVRYRTSVNVWCLNEVHLTLRQFPEEFMCNANSAWETTSRKQSTCIQLKYTEPAVLDAELVKVLLAEISTHNPAYPVRRVYRHLTARKALVERGSAGAAGPDKENTTPPETPANSQEVPGSRKRKLDFAAPASEGKRTRRSGEWGVVVNLDSEEEEEAGASNKGKKGKRKPLKLSLRRSSRRKGQEEDEKKTEEKKEEELIKEEEKEQDVKEKTEDVSCKRELAWTDKYAPQSSAEFLGNSKCADRLKEWLNAWKRQTCLEMQRMERELKKQAKQQRRSLENVNPNNTDKNSSNKEWWDEEDSDFDLDGDDSESDYNPEDDCSQCNSMLVTGPHGVGKTALVYALAQELGYKVFEVNASSRRSGKQVLSQLQEATQSHQVANKSLDDVFSTILSGKSLADVPTTSTKKKDSPKKMPTAFANFFKPGAGKAAAGESKEEVKSGKKGKANKLPAVEVTASPKRGRRGAKKEDEASPAPKRRGRAKKIEEEVEDSPVKPRAKRGRRKSSDDVQFVKEEASPLKKKGKKNALASFAAQAPPTPTTAKRKGLDLASVSLILFEEVDLVLREDTGFWAAVQTFMNTTKRPIILTTSDRGFLRRFDPRGELRVETLSLRVTMMPHIASHLQVLCLVEGLRTDPQQLLKLVQLYGGDIRRSLLAVQAWLESGGAANPCQKPVVYSEKCLNKKSEAASGLATLAMDENSQGAVMPSIPTPSKSSKVVADSEDEFEVRQTRRPRNKRRRLVIEDETSCDSMPGTPVKPLSRLTHIMEESSQDSQTEDDLLGETMTRQTSVLPPSEQDLVTVPSTQHTPLWHGGLLESTCGVKLGDQGILQAIDSSALIASDLHSTFLHYNVDLVGSNLEHLLHLPTQVLPPSTYTRHQTSAPASTSTTKRRIRNNNDLFDSEDSDNEEVKDTAKEDKPVQQKPVKRTLSQDERILGSCVDSLCELYDSMSYADTYLNSVDYAVQGKCSGKRFDVYGGSVYAGLGDCHAKFDTRSVGQVQDVSQEARAVVCSYSVMKARRKLSELQSNSAKAVKDGMTIPVEEKVDRLKLDDLSSLQSRQASNHRRTLENVYDCVNPRPKKDRTNEPVTASVSKWAIVQDYMPCLRTMCKSEQIRQAAKTKRRFLHYFDQIHLQMKQSSVDNMCSSFT